MSKVSFILYFLITVFPFFLSQGFAEPALIPYKSNTKVYQPGERVIIAFNGHEEILILGQFIKTNRYSKLLGMLPLPAEPEVGYGSSSSFRKVRMLLNREGVLLPLRTPSGKHRKKTRRFQLFIKNYASTYPVWTLVERFTKTDELVCFLKKKVGSENLTTPSMSNSAKELLGSYIKQGYEFFFFEQLRGRPEVRRVIPIFLKFPSDKLYFPLQLGQFFSRPGEVRLFFFYTKNMFEKPFRYILRENWAVTEEVTVTTDNVAKVDTRFKGFFRSVPVAGVSALYRGPLDVFRTEISQAP